MEQILSEVRSYVGVLELAPQEGSEHPAISWGDYFFYYAADHVVPRNRQPYATIITKDYPDDASSQLDAPDRWRLNIHVGPLLFTELVGFTPDSLEESEVDFSTTDVFLPHPLYGAYGWISIVNPGPSTIARALEVLREAHRADQRRVERRDRTTAENDR